MTTGCKAVVSQFWVTRCECVTLVLGSIGGWPQFFWFCKVTFVICSQKCQSGTLDLRSEVSNVQDQGDVYDLQSKTSEEYFRFAVRSIPRMPPAGLEPATRGLRVHCSTNWAKGAHRHVRCQWERKHIKCFCASVVTCYGLTLHLVTLAWRRI